MTTRVLVIGSGPAGLAAAARLLERGRDKVSVRLVHMGHHLGGKAASYVDGHGRKTEHGWHMVLGFYHRMRALMRRAGVREDAALSSMNGKSHVHESWSRALHTLDSSGGRVAFAARFAEYDGLPADDRFHYARFMTQAFARALSGEDLTQHDDVCFDTWAAEHGLRPHLVQTSLFRFSREAYFNFPERISAYHMLRTLALMSDSDAAEAFVCRGGWSDLVWDPIGRYVTSLGATIEQYVMATDWIYEGRRIIGVRVAQPDPAGHGHGTAPWSTAKLPVLAGTERTLADFDVVISTIPHAVFVTMNPSDERMWQSGYFRRLKNLRSAATVSMRVVTRTPVMDRQGPVFGLPAPLGIAVNMTSHITDKPDSGSVISFVGQERGFEQWSDDQIASFTLDNFSRVPGVGDLRAAGIAELEIHRNRADFERILLCEPGVQPFRPGPLTPFTNLFLAGDWVQNAIDVICMEGAVVSGENAADQVLASLGGT